MPNLIEPRMKYLLSIALLVFSLVGFAQETREIYQRAKISYSEKAELIHLGELGVPVDLSLIHI